jgi:hypothetical protein
MVFLAGVFAVVLCVSRPYPFLDAGAPTIWLLALCLCAGVILFGTPRDAAIISRDVAWRCSPGFWLRRYLANGAFDSSQEVLHPTSVVHAVYGRRGSRLIVQSWRPRQTDRVSVSGQILSLRPPWILFSRSAGYGRHPFRGARNAVGEQDIAITTDLCVVRKQARCPQQSLDFLLLPVASLEQNNTRRGDRGFRNHD